MTNGWARRSRAGELGAGMAAAGKSFEATIGVEVKGDTWSCVEIPDSAEFFGTGKTVRVDVTVDDVKLENVGAMVGSLKADLSYDGAHKGVRAVLTAAC